MNTVAQHKIRFWEGGNVAAAVLTPVAFAVCIYFYKSLVRLVGPLGIRIEDVYGYTFNLFAVELGALLALFALFACKPTPFLERMKNTAAFAAIVSNTNITLVLTCITIAATFVLGLLRLEPDANLTSHSVVFLIWLWWAVSAISVYARTIRLILIALA